MGLLKWLRKKKRKAKLYFVVAAIMTAAVV
jgi:hypothetical protein